VFTQKTKLALPAIFLALTAFAISANSAPSLVTTIAETLGSPYENFGYIFMLQYLSFALASVSGGWAVSRFGVSNRSLVTAGLIGMGLTLAAAAALPSMSWFVAWAVPLGYAGGLTETFSSIMICRLSGPNASRMMNLSQVFYCIGAILAPQLVAVLLDWQIHWRAAFITLGTPIFLITVVFVLFTRRLNSNCPPQTVNSERPNPKSDIENSKSGIPLRADPLFYCLTAALFIYVTVECSIVCWVAAYFEKHLEVTASAAARRISIYWMGLIVGRAMMLVVPVNWSLGPAAVTGAVGMTVGAALMSLHWSPLTATILIALSGTAAGPVWPVIVAASGHLRDSTKFTSAVIAAGALGAAFGPLLTSYVIRYGGLTAMFPTLTLASSALLGTLLLGRTCSPPGVRSRNAI